MSERSPAGSRSAVLQQLAAGALSLGEAAQRLGTTEVRARELLEVFELTRELLPPPSPLSGSRRGLALVAAVSVLLGALGATAASSACPNGYPFCFAADTPARAGQINHNFAQVKEWLETKTGSVNAGVITASGLTVNNPGTASFGSNFRQMLNLWGTSYGIGVQDSTQYFRTPGGFAWYRGGSEPSPRFSHQTRPKTSRKNGTARMISSNLLMRS